MGVTTTFNEESTLDEIMSAGVRATIELNRDGKERQLVPSKPWRKKVGWLKSTPGLRRSWTASKAMVTIAPLAPLTILLPSPMSVWGGLFFAANGITALGISIRNGRFLDVVKGGSKSIKDRWRRFSRHWRSDRSQVDRIRPLETHDETSLGNWRVMGWSALLSLIMSMMFMIINGGASALSWALVGTTVAAAMLDGAASYALGGASARDLMEDTEEKINHAIEEETIIENGDPSNALDDYTAQGDKTAMAIAERYGALEEQVVAHGQSLDVWRSKYVLAFQSIRKLFDLKARIKESPADYSMSLDQINEMLETSSQGMLRAINDDVRRITDQYSDSVKADANYVSGLDDDLLDSEPTVSSR